MPVGDRGVGWCGAGVPGGSKSPNKGARNWTQALEEKILALNHWDILESTF